MSRAISRFWSRVSWLALLATLAMVVAACGSDDEGSGGDGGGDDAGGGAAELESVTLRMPYVLDVSTAPFFLARDRGYYEEAGFDVDIEAGRGSTTTVQTVGSGADAFGVATGDASIALASSGGDTRMIAVLQRSSPAALVYKDNQSIQSVEDLAEPDVVVVTSAGDSYHQQLIGLMKEAGMSRDDVEFRFVDYSTFPAQYRQLDKAVIVGGLDSEAIQYREFDPDVQSTGFSTLGLPLYGNVVVTSQKRIDSNPEGVKGFVEATLRGWEEAREDPQAAVDALVAAEPDLQGQADTPAALEQLEVTLGLTDAAGETNQPAGPIDEATVSAMLEFVKNYMDVDVTGTPDSYYTNEFTGAP